jgi:hypothetical protein
VGREKPLLPPVLGFSLAGQRRDTGADMAEMTWLRARGGCGALDRNGGVADERIRHREPHGGARWTRCPFARYPVQYHNAQTIACRWSRSWRYPSYPPSSPEGSVFVKIPFLRTICAQLLYSIFTNETDHPPPVRPPYPHVHGSAMVRSPAL